MWYYARSTLETEELKNNLITGWHWIITNPSHGSQKFIADDIQLAQIECFKEYVSSRLEEMQYETLQDEPAVLQGAADG